MNTRPSTRINDWKTDDEWINHLGHFLEERHSVESEQACMIAMDILDLLVLTDANLPNLDRYLNN
jgi:hypothetical protein